MEIPTAKETLSEFVIGKRIGKGTYGEVYSAHMRTGTQEKVALKRVAMSDHADRGVPSSVIREVSLLFAMGKHDNIVTLLDVKICADEICMVFELMDCDLHTHLKSLPPGVLLDAATLRSFVRQLLAGVAWCHRHSIMHRDLKPQNILIRAPGQLKVADMGMSRMFRRDNRAYTPTVTTLWYRPPEVLLGCDRYTTELDMWSIGCIITEMATRAAVFPGESEFDQLFRIFQVCGTPTESNWPDASKLKHFASMSFDPRPADPKWPLSLAAKTSALFADLVTALLALDPLRRISASAALDHPYFFELAVS